MDKSSATASCYRDPPDLSRKETFANRIEAEQSEAVAWMNQHLIAGGQSDKLMNDLAGDIADGVTLLRVVEAVAQEPLPRYNTNPVLRVHKQENMQMCLQFLKKKGVALKGVHAEDLVGGNLKSILSLFHLLKQHFTEPAPSRDEHIKQRFTEPAPSRDEHIKQRFTEPAPSRDEHIKQRFTEPAPSRDEHIKQHFTEPAPSRGEQIKQRFTEPAPSRDHTPNSKQPSSQLSAPSAKNDPVLAWIGDQVNTIVTSYSNLRDGKTLCALVNSLRSLAIPNELVENGSSEDRLKTSLAAMECHLGVKGNDLNTRRIAEGRGDDLLQSYLGQCMVAWQQARGQRRDEQTLMTAVRATVMRLSLPGGAEAMSSPHLANTANQKQRSAEMVPLPVQATPIPSISVTSTIGDTPISMVTLTEPKPDKISRSRSVALPGQQVPRPVHNPGPGHRRGHSDVSATSSKEVWSLISNSGNDFVLSGDDETEMDSLTSPSSSLMSSPSGSTRHPRVPSSERTRYNQGIHSPSESTRGGLSPSERTRDIHSPSERTRDIHSPSERTRDIHSPSERTRDIHSPSERTKDIHSPSERTRGGLSPSERTRDIHSPSERARDIHSPTRGGHSPSERTRGGHSGSNKDHLVVSPRNLDFHTDSSLPKSQLGGHNMGGDSVPHPSSHSNPKPHDSRTGIVFSDHAPAAHDDRITTIASENHDSDFSTLPERNKHRAEEQLFPIARRTFSSPESLAARQAMNEDVLLATSLIEPSKPTKPHVSPLKRSQSQSGNAGSKINTSTISLDRPQRTSSITRLDYASEVPSKMDDLHERVTMLAAVMDSERQSLLKHLKDTVMRERTKREALECRVHQMETSAQKLHKHYSQCFLQLASQISTLRAQIADHRGDQNGGNVTLHVRESGSPEQQQEDSQQYGQQNTDFNADSSEVTANETAAKGETFFFKQRQLEFLEVAEGKYVTLEILTPNVASKTLLLPSARFDLMGTRRANPRSGPFFHGSETSFRKLLSFFGEEPPRLLNTEEFLRSLNYGDLYQKFKSNSITLAELKHIDEPMLEQLGVPLGPRLRILAEVKAIEQHHYRGHVGHGEEGLPGSSL